MRRSVAGVRIRADLDNERDRLRPRALGTRPSRSCCRPPFASPAAGLTTAAAFSPTDTMPMTAWAKLLMVVQSLASLLTVAIVISQAVNIVN